MKIRIFALCSFICLFFALKTEATTIAPIDTTIKHAVTEIYTESDLLPFNIWQNKPFKDVDTTIDKLEFYTNHYTLGNPGLPYVPIIFNSTPAPLGFFYGNDYLTDYVRNDTSVRYYNTRAPYLNFFYITDPMIHQYLDLSLTQNIGKKFNFAVEFHRIRSEGDYVNQGSNNNQLTLTTNYRTKRYMLLTDGIYNIFKVDQNGGIQADSDFNNSYYIGQRPSIPVYLATARTTLMKTSLRVQQYYYFGYNSSDTDKENPLMYVSHCGSISGSTNLYSDLTLIQDSDLNKTFNKNLYYAGATYDSLHYNQLNNDITIGSAKGWHTFLRWDAGVKDQWVHFTDYILTYHNISPTPVNTVDMHRDSIFTNLTAHARIYNTYANGHILFDASGGYIFAGTQKGDEQVAAHLGYRFDSLRLLKLSANYSLQTPALIYDLYEGNNFQWLNHFDKVNTSTASIQYMDAKWHINLGAEITQIKNLVYFNDTANPEQFSGIVHVLKLNIGKDLRVGKWHLNTKEIYQNAPSKAHLSFPKWVTENSLFYENYLFKHHLLLKVGVDVFYNTAYYAYNYMPVTDQYYIQNSNKLGNYVYFDPFVSFRIKTFRMFVKMENVTSDLLQPTEFYGYSDNYPMPDRVLRYGISWDFWN